MVEGWMSANMGHISHKLNEMDQVFIILFECIVRSTGTIYAWGIVHRHFMVNRT